MNTMWSYKFSFVFLWLESLGKYYLDFLERCCCINHIRLDYQIKLCLDDTDWQSSFEYNNRHIKHWKVHKYIYIHISKFQKIFKSVGKYLIHYTTCVLFLVIPAKRHDRCFRNFCSHQNALISYVWQGIETSEKHGRCNTLLSLILENYLGLFILFLPPPLQNYSFDASWME